MVFELLICSSPRPPPMQNPAKCAWNPRSHAQDEFKFYMEDAGSRLLVVGPGGNPNAEGTGMAPVVSLAVKPGAGGGEAAAPISFFFFFFFFCYTFSRRPLAL